MATNRSTWNRGTGYTEDSRFESDLRNGILKDLEYHPDKIQYSITHMYEPDWEIIQVIPTTPPIPTIHKKILIEAKGMFREASELQKYVAIQSALEENEYCSELVFLFQKPHAGIYFKPKRKDGTKMTHAQWCEKHGFRWYTVDTIKELLEGRG